MLPDRVSNPGPLTYESGALPTALRGPATGNVFCILRYIGIPTCISDALTKRDNFHKCKTFIFRGNLILAVKKKLAKIISPSIL